MRFSSQWRVHVGGGFWNLQPMKDVYIQRVVKFQPITDVILVVSTVTLQRRAGPTLKSAVKDSASTSWRRSPSRSSSPMTSTWSPMESTARRSTAPGMEWSGRWEFVRSFSLTLFGRFFLLLFSLLAFLLLFPYFQIYVRIVFEMCSNTLTVWLIEPAWSARREGFARVGLFYCIYRARQAQLSAAQSILTEDEYYLNPAGLIWLPLYPSLRGALIRSFQVWERRGEEALHQTQRGRVSSGKSLRESPYLAGINSHIKSHSTC